MNKFDYALMKDDCGNDGVWVYTKFVQSLRKNLFYMIINSVGKITNIVTHVDAQDEVDDEGVWYILGLDSNPIYIDTERVILTSSIKWMGLWFCLYIRYSPNGGNAIVEITPRLQSSKKYNPYAGNSLTEWKELKLSYADATNENYWPLGRAVKEILSTAQVAHTKAIDGDPAFIKILPNSLQQLIQLVKAGAEKLGRGTDIDT